MRARFVSARWTAINLPRRATWRRKRRRQRLPRRVRRKRAARRSASKLVRFGAVYFERRRRFTSRARHDRQAERKRGRVRESAQRRRGRQRDRGSGFPGLMASLAESPPGKWDSQRHVSPSARYVATLPIFVFSPTPSVRPDPGSRYFRDIQAISPIMVSRFPSQLSQEPCRKYNEPCQCGAVLAKRSVGARGKRKVLQG